MPAGLVIPVSGPYTGTWALGGLLGIMDDDGFVLTGTWHGEEINATDAYGMTLVEAIYRGLDWRVSFVALEFNQLGIIEILNTFGVTDLARVGEFNPKLDYIGERYSTFARALVLNSILGAYPPTTPQTFTAVNAVIAPETNVEMLMTSKMREVPIDMVLLPYVSAAGTLTLPPVSFTTS